MRFFWPCRQVFSTISGPATWRSPRCGRCRWSGGEVAVWSHGGCAPTGRSTVGCGSRLLAARSPPRTGSHLWRHVCAGQGKKSQFGRRIAPRRGAGAASVKGGGRAWPAWSESAARARCAQRDVSGRAACEPWPRSGRCDVCRTGRHAFVGRVPAAWGRRVRAQVAGLRRDLRPEGGKGRGEELFRFFALPHPARESRGAAGHGEKSRSGRAVRGWPAGAGATFVRLF